MRVGYVRVSSVDQNTARQLDGVEVERTFTDQASGKDTARPELEEMIRYVRDGDVVLVHSMDRLARNLEDLRRIVRTLTGKGVRVEFVKEHLTFSGEDSPMATLMLSVMGAFAEFERALILERQREGIAAAKSRGVYTGRKPALTGEQVVELRRRATAGERKAALAREYRISRETVYAYLRAGAAGAPAVEVTPAPPASTAPAAQTGPEPVAPDVTPPGDPHGQDATGGQDHLPGQDVAEQEQEQDQGEAELAAVLDRLPLEVVARPEPDVARYDVLLPDRRATTSSRAGADAGGAGGRRPRVVDLSGDLDAPAGTWGLVETEPGSGSWAVHRDGVRVGMVRRESTTRGRRGWSARLDIGGPLPAHGDLATAAGSSLWRTRDLAAAGIARHLATRRPSRGGPARGGPGTSGSPASSADSPGPAGVPASWDRGDFMLWRTQTGWWELDDPDGVSVQVDGLGQFGTVRGRVQAQTAAAAVIARLTGRAVTGWDEDHDGYGATSYTAALAPPTS